MCSSDLPELQRPLRGDPLRLEQVLLNFTSNAIKFSEQGTVLVRASVLRTLGAETMVRFEVRDRGIGIAAEELPKLFAPFHQADPSTTRRYGGTGLGLVISKQLAELMGGEVGVDSKPGEGSTFWVDLPFTVAPASVQPEVCDAALYEQGRVRHVGAFPELEDEMCSALGEGTKSPDRLDALVWAVSELALRARHQGPQLRRL